MGAVAAFSISVAEESQIRQCARIFFDGGNPGAIEDLREYWQRWGAFFDSFLIMRDVRYGNILHLPYSGGVLEQPAKTMSVYRAIQNYFCEHLEEKMKESIGGLRGAYKH